MWCVEVSGMASVILGFDLSCIALGIALKLMFVILYIHLPIFLILDAASIAFFVKNGKNERFNKLQQS